jgi:hypothetical protein
MGTRLDSNRFPVVNKKRDKDEMTLTVDQLIDLSSNVNRLLGLVTELVTKVDDTSTKVEKIGVSVNAHGTSIFEMQSHLTLSCENKSLSVKEISLHSSLTPVSALTETEESPMDKAWRDFELSTDLNARLTEPDQMEEIALSCECEFLLQIRLFLSGQLIFLLLLISVVVFRQLLNNIETDPDGPNGTYSQQDKIKIDLILYNIITRGGPCKKGLPQVKEHPDRTKFRRFIRTAQFQLFNPDRPRKTGMFLIH